MPVEALVDGCPLYDLEPAEPEGWIYGNRGDARDARRLGRGDAARAARLAQHRLASAGPSSSTTRWSARAPCAGPESADAAVLQLPEAGQRDRRLDRRQRPPRRLRSLRRHGRGGARVRAEPRLRRRRAARPDQLPQLRQPREAGPRLAARPLGQRPRRRLRGARRPGRRRQRLPLQRGRRTARSTRPRWSAWSASCPTRRAVAGSAFAREGDAIALLGPFAPTLAGSELAKLRGELGRRPAAARRRRGRRRLRDVRDAVRAGARLRPRHQRRRPRLRPGRGGDRRRPRLPRSTSSRLSRPRLLARGGAVRRGPRRLRRSAATAPGWRRWPAARRP